MRFTLTEPYLCRFSATQRKESPNPNELCPQNRWWKRRKCSSKIQRMKNGFNFVLVVFHCPKMFPLSHQCWFLDMWHLRWKTLSSIRETIFFYFTVIFHFRCNSFEIYFLFWNDAMELEQAGNLNELLKKRITINSQNSSHQKDMITDIFRAIFLLRFFFYNRKCQLLYSELVSVYFDFFNW